MKNRVWIVAGSGGQGKNAVSFDLQFRQERFVDSEIYRFDSSRRFEPILRESHYGGALVALNDEYLLISGKQKISITRNNGILIRRQFSASKLDGSADRRSNFMVILVSSARAYFWSQDDR